MKRFLSLILALSIATVFADIRFSDKSGEEVLLTWNLTEDLTDEAAVFLKGFSEGYAHLTPEILKVPSIEQFLENAIANEKALKAKDPEHIRWAVAKKNNTVIGLAVFELNHYPEEVYLRQLVILPEHQRKGIGSKLSLFILEAFPDIQKLCAVSRKVNERGITFLKNMGFKETEYSHEGYDPNVYQGLELSLKE
jgi:ribosomal protein S18 acetylase RimI-like enzyme